MATEFRKRVARCGTNGHDVWPGQNVDLYIPRKCSWTNRLITAKDHASIQINVGHLDEQTGVFTGQSTTFALSGFVRAMGDADSAVDKLWAAKKPQGQ